MEVNKESLKIFNLKKKRQKKRKRKGTKEQMYNWKTNSKMVDQGPGVCNHIKYK